MTTPHTTPVMHSAPSATMSHPAKHCWHIIVQHMTQSVNKLVAPGGEGHHHHQVSKQVARGEGQLSQESFIVEDKPAASGIYSALSTTSTDQVATPTFSDSSLSSTPYCGKRLLIIMLSMEL